MGFSQHRYPRDSLSRAEAVQPHMEQSGTRCRGGIDQACLDMGRIRQSFGITQIGDKVMALIPGHKSFSWLWPSRVIAPSAARTP